MKAKNQVPRSSEEDAREKLIIYVYEYLMHSQATKAAQTFLEEIKYERIIRSDSMDGQGFLVNWWCVFWDLYCAEPGKSNQPEPSSDARAFHEYNMRSVMSPQTSPPQPHVGGPPPPPGPAPFMGSGGGGGQMPMAGPRYGPPPPHPGGPMRGGGPPSMNPGPPPSRMQGMVQPLQPPQMGAPPPHGPPHPQMMGGAGSPRYAQHPGHMTPSSSASGGGPVGGPEPGPSPGLPNRMTPNHSGSPHPQIGGPPGGGMQQMGGPPPMSQGGPPPPPPSMQRGPGGMPPQGGPGGPPSGWQANQFNVNSPADQQCFMPGPPGSSGQQGEFGGMMMNDGSGAPPNQQPPANQPQDEYVMPGAYGQQPDQGENNEIMKLKESLENNTNEGDQSAFNMDFPDGQPKW